MEYIDKDFKDKNDYEKLCNEEMTRFHRKGKVGGIFVYNEKYLIKKTIVSKKICNEATILKEIGILMNSKKIPQLFSKVSVIYRCKHSDFSVYRHDKKITDSYNYIFIMEKYGDPVWKVIDSKDVKKIKSVTIMILIGIWHMNHNGNMYHDDICAKLTNYFINNILLEKTKKKNMSFHLLGSKKINVKLYGHKIRIIDFGKACYKDTYIHEKIRTERTCSINRFYRTNRLFKNFKFNSEILFILKCLFAYWNCTNVDDILFGYYHKIAKKYSALNKFDDYIIRDFNKNFLKIIGMFSDKWPNPPYYMIVR